MTERNHTSGPWAVGTSGSGDLWVAGPDADAPVICDLVSRNSTGYAEVTEEDEANARLIAAAPELYHTCKAIILCFGLGQTPEKFVEQVSGLIEDARAVIVAIDKAGL